MKKDPVAALLVIEEKENLDDLTWNNWLTAVMNKILCPTEFYSCWLMEQTIPKILL